MYTFFIILHVFVCILLIIVVLLQADKGGGLSGALGGGLDSNAILGSRGTATLLNKTTTILAILFMLIVGAVNLLKPGAGQQSIIEKNRGKLQSEVPVGELPGVETIDPNLLIPESPPAPPTGENQ